MFYKRDLSIFYYWKKLSFFFEFHGRVKGGRRWMFWNIKTQRKSRKATGANGIFVSQWVVFLMWTTKNVSLTIRAKRPRSINRIVSTEGLCHWTRAWFNSHCVICKLMMFEGSPWSTCLRETKDSITWLFHNDLTKPTAPAKTIPRHFSIRRMTYLLNGSK